MESLLNTQTCIHILTYRGADSQIYVISVVPLALTYLLWFGPIAYNDNNVSLDEVPFYKDIKNRVAKSDPKPTAAYDYVYTSYMQTLKRVLSGTDILSDLSEISSRGN